MYGNISSSMLDHLAKFFILPELPLIKHNIISHNWEDFINLSLLENFLKINYNRSLQFIQYNVKVTLENCLNTLNTLINSYTSLKNSTKNKENFNKNHEL